MEHEEQQYLNLIRTTINSGTIEEGRNGKTISHFGNMMRFSLENNTIPLLTTKKLAWKTCFKELMFFINGQTDNKILKENNVHIWDVNGSREFLNSRGLFHRYEDDLGPIYGFQWRHWNANYNHCSDNYENCGIDQLKNIIDTLKNPDTRTSRRMILTVWNPEQINTMALPPCHIMSQFNVENGKLNCHMYQRSADVFLGLPFNITSYALLTNMIARTCEVEVGNLYISLGDAHIYKDHIEQVKMQIKREEYTCPKVKINVKERMEEYEYEDIKVIDYEAHPAIKGKMAV